MTLLIFRMDKTQAAQSLTIKKQGLRQAQPTLLKGSKRGLRQAQPTFPKGSKRGLRQAQPTFPKGSKRGLRQAQPTFLMTPSPPSPIRPSLNLRTREHLLAPDSRPPLSSSEPAWPRATAPTQSWQPWFT